MLQRRSGRYVRALLFFRLLLQKRKTATVGFPLLEHPLWLRYFSKQCVFNVAVLAFKCLLYQRCKKYFSNYCPILSFSSGIYIRGTGRWIWFHSCTHTFNWRLALSFRCGLKRDGAQLSLQSLRFGYFRRNILGKQCTAIATRAKFISPCRSRSL